MTLKFCLVKVLTLLVLWILIVAPLGAQTIYCGEDFVKFKTAKQAACGSRDEAIRLGREIIKKLAADKRQRNVVEYIKNQIPIIEAEDQRCRSVESLEAFFNIFKAAGKKPCGERDSAISLGKFIVEKYGTDELNKDVITYAKKRVEDIEKEEKTCREAPGCGTYQSKNWKEFFAASREIIKKEGNSPLALDVMLTFVSVSYDRAVDAKDRADTIFYAKEALKRIEAGQKSQTGRWGVFEPFNTKESALTWMNYIIGRFYYDKLNQKKEALPFLYKATQIGDEKKNDIGIYANIGSFYFDETAGLNDLYKIKRKASRNRETAATKSLQALARGTAERAMEAFGKAYQIARWQKEKKQLADTLYKTLTDLYNFRFNRPPDSKPPDLMDAYLKNLITRPMSNPAVPVNPVKDEPQEIKIERKKAK